MSTTPPIHGSPEIEPRQPIQGSPEIKPRENASQATSTPKEQVIGLIEEIEGKIKSTPLNRLIDLIDAAMIGIGTLPKSDQKVEALRAVADARDALKKNPPDLDGALHDLDNAKAILISVS
jgi:hypothetical protein